jgi:hypothetical protein
MAAKKVKKKKEQLKFEKIHSSFTTNTESLEAFVNNVAPIAEKHDKATGEATREKLVKFAKGIRKIFGVNNGKLDKKKRKQLIEGMTEDQVSQIIQLTTDLPRLTLPQAELLYRSSFVMLVSFFDFLISDLIHYFYRKYPESLSEKELPLTLSELKLLGGVDEAIDSVINKQADSVLYKSLAEQKLYLKNTLKIDTRDSIINWNKLIEAVERRHIVVHNNCKINRRYLTNVDLSQIPEKTKDLKEGRQVRITESYFRSVFEEICVSGIVLLQCCWRKWEKDDMSDADSGLNSDIYDALLKENWIRAERLGLFSKECKVANQASRLALNVNYCQSLKWQGKKNELEEELKKFDISALSPRFALALYALRSDHDSFYKNVEHAITVDKMQETDFMEWPLFRELRKDPDYEARIKTVFRSISEKEGK